MFDPRKRKFSAEELKPQPMIKKARKVFIPEDMKVRSRPGSGEDPVRPDLRKPGSDPSLLRSLGRAVLGPTPEEQRGGQEVTGRPQAEGEPDRYPGQLPGEGERRPARGGGRHEEGAGPLQKHSGQI